MDKHIGLGCMSKLEISQNYRKDKRTLRKLLSNRKLELPKFFSKTAKLITPKEIWVIIDELGPWKTA